MDSRCRDRSAFVCICVARRARYSRNVPEIHLGPTFIDRRRDDNSSGLPSPQLNYPLNMPWTIINSHSVWETRFMQLRYSIPIPTVKCTSAIFSVLKQPAAFFFSLYIYIFFIFRYFIILLHHIIFIQFSHLCLCFDRFDDYVIM